MYELTPTTLYTRRGRRLILYIITLDLHTTYIYVYLFYIVQLAVVRVEYRKDANTH
jgi:hypothetical protein